MKTCLIVDDSRVIRKVARQIFESLGYTCSEAENGQFALDACKAAFPDFVLLDWNMPVMNGLDFLKAVRQLPDGNKPVVVLCTTENDLNHIQQALGAGANEYIMKPFDADIIRGKLQQLGLID
jgi:two-component system chemotaxis response regulator CheY